MSPSITMFPCFHVSVNNDVSISPYSALKNENKFCFSAIMRVSEGKADKVDKANKTNKVETRAY